MKILVCEDNILASRVMSAMLQRRGFSTEIASDGNDALKKIISGDPDLVICDVNLPKRNGMELVRYMRTELSREIPVIMISAYSEPKIQQQARDLGVNDFFVKPFDNEILINRIELLLKQ